MTFIQWAIILLLGVPLCVAVTGFVVAVTYMQVQEACK
jgi:hypothetical protein